MTDGVLKSYVQFCEDNNYNNGAIIVMSTSPSENILDMIRTMNTSTKPLIQLFNVRYLQFDISSHRKVPNHRIISTEESAELQKRMKIVDPKMQLPWIDSQDAMAKWLGARTGDIIEITRLSESSGNSLYYRYCVSNVLDT
jgi:DNA-directed RNA polymerase I, II, and III subunit RPABC1